jgi:hypothetical protein
MEASAAFDMGSQYNAIQPFEKEIVQKNKNPIFISYFWI